jgi:catechol 2,3-dioxygenase-like lactoylglutathione lyase family enzyme
MPPVRIIPYPAVRDLPASSDFYAGALGLRVVMEDPVQCLQSPANPAAQVILTPPGFEQPQPAFGVDLGDAAAVDAAHAEAVRRGLRIAYPLRDEPWGVHRFFVEDPGGTIVNVLAHVR